MLKPSSIFPPKLISYRKDFGETNNISFVIKSDELFDKNNEVWGKVKKVSKQNLIVNLSTIKNI